MLDLNQMSVFIRVVQEGSFTGAAKSLDMPKSRVSRMITDLEDKLNIRLLERTTREVRPTDVGLQYYEEYKPLFEEIDDIHLRISDNQSEPSGLLRIAAPVGFAMDVMGKWMAEFKALYPLVDMELVFMDGDVHLIRDGFDVGFAMGHLQDSTLIARKFDDTDPMLCASPEYVEKHGPITHPNQLNDLSWVVLGSRQGYSHNTVFVNKQTGERVEIDPKPAVTVNHHEVALHHLLAGQGIAINAAFFIYEQLLSGNLVTLLPDWEVEQEPLHLVFPSGRHQAKKVRAFIDFFMSRIQEVQNLMEECAHLSPEEQGKLLREHMESTSLLKHSSR